MSLFDRVQIMNNLLYLVIGVAAGAYFAEEIREKIPALDKSDVKSDKNTVS